MGQTHGRARVTLELNQESFPMDVVVVSPLTAEGILGLHFLQTQRPSINLDKEQVLLAECNCTISLYRPSLQPRS